MAFLCLILLISCKETDWDKAKTPGKWILSNPVTFDLKIPPLFFRSHISEKPHFNICHTQGMEIINNEIFISCCLYNPKQKMRRSFDSESILLKAKLTEIEDPKKRPHIRWELSQLTEIAPQGEQERISKSITKNLPAMVGTFMNWLLPLEEIKHVMGHPSGIIFDEKRKGLWLANAVYGHDSYTHVHLIDPKTLKPYPNRTPIALKEHVGFIATTKENFLWGFNWGQTPQMILIDPQTGRTRKENRPVSPLVAYQDCDRLNKDLIVCAGGEQIPGSWYAHRNGILHILETSGTDFDDFAVHYKDTLYWLPKSSKRVSSKFGIRSFVSVEKLGDIEMDKMNRYGHYLTPLPLTNAGMAIGQKKRYIYFLPDDLPKAKLIRFELHKVPTTDLRLLE